MILIDLCLRSSVEIAVCTGHGALHRIQHVLCSLLLDGAEEGGANVDLQVVI